MGQALTNTLSAQLITQSGSPATYTTITNDGGNVARYRKTTTNGGSQPGFAFSPTNNMVARTSGYVTFKIKQNIDGTVPVANTFFMGIGNTNLTTSVSSGANRFITIQFKQSGTSANTLSIESAGTNVVNSFSYNNSTSFGRVQIWFNDSDTSPLSYTNPSGVSVSLQTNSFVVYFDGTLVTTTNSGNAPLTGAGGASLNIGKIGFGTSSGGTIDYSFSDIYAADAAPGVTNTPTITSAPSANAYIGIPFSYQIVTDPTGATSYACSGTLPNGLTFDSSNGVISGTPTAVGGPTSVVLTASNSVGMGAGFNLAITVSLPVNVFSGNNASLNTQASWSLNSVPGSSANSGSYTDLVLNSSETNLTTTSGNIYGKSWNITNGGNYTVKSVATTNATSFKFGNTGNPDSYPYSNAVAGMANVMLFLTNSSKLTFLPTNSVSFLNSVVQLRNSGTMVIGAGSLAEFQTSIDAAAVTNFLTKAGAGTLNFGASNSFAGGLTVSEGTVNATAANSLGAGILNVNGGAVNAKADNAWTGSKALTINGGMVTFSGSNNFTGVTTLTGGILRLSNSAALGPTNSVGTFILSGGSVEALADYDLGHTYGTVTSNVTTNWITLAGETTTINGPVTFNVSSNATLGLYKISGNTNSLNVITKNGDGTLLLRGGGATGIVANWQINQGTLFINTTASGGLGISNTIVMNGGNLLFSKGVSSTGTYSGHGQDTGLQVLADTTITLDPNPATLASNNTASFTNLTVGTKTIRVAKGTNTKSSATDAGYTDPKITFNSGSLTGQATLDVATNMETVLQAASGTGGLTKTGEGKLTLSTSATLGPNSYTGPTLVNAGSLALRGSNSSTITMGGQAVLDLPLPISSTNVPTTSGGLIFSNGAKVRISSAPTLASYTLVSASNGITGTPLLESAISGYQLAVSGNSLVLQQSASAPANLSYGTTELSCTYGLLMTTVTPTCDNSPTSYSIDPALPGGLNFSTVDGSIGGTPTAASPRSLYTVTATNAGGNTQTTFYLAVAKATPTITVAPTASAITAGQALSASILSGGSGSTAGSFAWTDSSIVPPVGTGSQSVTFIPSDTANFNTATTSVSLEVNAAGGISNWLAGAATNAATVGKYLIGGGTNVDAASEQPVIINTNATNLILSAIVRTNDTKGSVVGQWVTNVSGFSSLASGSNEVAGTRSANQTGVDTTQCERREFSVPRTNGTDRLFLRLKATWQP